jgi:hypothetical protein
LQALATLSTISDRDANEVCECLAPTARPPPPEAEKLLPVVHTTWGFMLQGLAPNAVPGRCEVAASLLADVMEIAGSFAAARFERDAAPLLLRLIAGSGVISSKNGEASGGSGCRYLEEEEASGSRARRQNAALLCVKQCCQNVQGRKALERVVERMALGALQCLSDTADVANSSLQCVLALARVDADAVWLAVVQVVQTLQPELLKAYANGQELAGLEKQDAFPQKRPGVQVAAQCMRLLREVDAVDVAWHVDVRRARAERHMDGKV